MEAMWCSHSSLFLSLTPPNIKAWISLRRPGIGRPIGYNKVSGVIFQLMLRESVMMFGVLVGGRLLLLRGMIGVHLSGVLPTVSLKVSSPYWIWKVSSPKWVSQKKTDHSGY